MDAPDYQELVQRALKGESLKSEDVPKKTSPQLGLFGDEPEQTKQPKKSAPKKESDTRRGVQPDMFEREKKDIKAAEAEKRFKEMKKLEDRPLPKHHRLPGGGGGMMPDTEKVPGKRLLKMAKGGAVKSSASKRADGIAQRGKTRGVMR